MHSTIHAGNGYTISLDQTRGLGSIWVVRTYKRVLFFRRIISSDWFLDSPQAQQFAEQVAAELRADANSDYLRQRNPGWTFRPPIR